MFTPNVSRVPPSLKMSTLEVPTPNPPGHTSSGLGPSHRTASTASLAVTDSSGGYDHTGDPSSGRGRSQTASSAQTLPSLDLSGRTASSDTVDSPPGGSRVSETLSSVSSLAVIQEAAGEEGGTDKDGDGDDQASPSAERGRKRDVKPLSPSECTGDAVTQDLQSPSTSQPHWVLDQIFMGSTRRPHNRQRSTELRQVLFRVPPPPESQARSTLAHKASLSSLAQTETTLRPRALSRTSLADSEAIAVLSARAQSARPPRSRDREEANDLRGESQSDTGLGDTESEPSIGRFDYIKAVNDPLISPDNRRRVSRWRSMVAPPDSPERVEGPATPVSVSTSFIRPPCKPRKVIPRAPHTNAEAGPSTRSLLTFLSTSKQSFVTPKRRQVLSDDDLHAPPESPLDDLCDIIASLPRHDPPTSEAHWFSPAPVVDGAPSREFTSLSLRGINNYCGDDATPVQGADVTNDPLNDVRMDIDDSPLKGKAQPVEVLDSIGGHIGGPGSPKALTREPAEEPMETDHQPSSPLPLVKRIQRPESSPIHTNPSSPPAPIRRIDFSDTPHTTARSVEPLSIRRRRTPGLSLLPATTSTPLRFAGPSTPLRFLKKLPQSIGSPLSPSCSHTPGPLRRGSLLGPGAFKTPIRQIVPTTLATPEALQTPSPLGSRTFWIPIKNHLPPPVTPAPGLSLQTPIRPVDTVDDPTLTAVGKSVIIGGLPVKRSCMAHSAEKAPPEAPRKAAPRRHTTISSKPAPLNLHKRTPSENPFVATVKTTKGLPRPLAARDTNKGEGGPSALKGPELEPGGDPREFEVTDTLGSGSFGEVAKVIQRSTGKVLAKKCIRGNTSSPSERREEVAILRYLSKRPHRGIIAYIASWETHNSLSECHIVTTFCPRGTLKSHLLKIADQGGMGEAGAWMVLDELSSAIEHIHKLRICHHDIKPDNILVAAHYSLVLADFGVASGVDQEGLLANTCPTLPAVLPCGWHSWPKNDKGNEDLMPIPEHEERSGDKTYMPREGCLGGKDVGLPTDIFALGMVILEIACNVVLPIEGDEWHQLRSDDFRILKSNFTQRRCAAEGPFDSAYTPSRPLLTPDLLDLLLDQMLVQDSRKRSSVSTIRTHPILRYLSRWTDGRAPAPGLTADDRWFADYLKEEWSYTGDCTLHREEAKVYKIPPKLTSTAPCVVQDENPCFTTPPLPLPPPPKPKVVDENPFLTVKTTKISTESGGPSSSSTSRISAIGSTASTGSGSMLPRWKVPAVQRTWRKGYKQ